MASSANPPMHKCFTSVHEWLISSLVGNIVYSTKGCPRQQCASAAAIHSGVTPVCVSCAVVHRTLASQVAASAQASTWNKRCWVLI